jgi:Flp pilus assembly protein protease CpaA
VVMKTGIGPSQILNALLYAVVYISAVLILAIIIFRKREFQ